MANYKTAISICTSDSAKALDVTSTIKTVNGEQNVIFGGDTYKDLKTYNDEIDSSDNRNKEICKEITDPRLNTKIAYPLCPIFGSPGFIRSPRDNSKCIAFDCPPDWERDGDICKKPLVDAIIDKRSKCDDRWYDWITIPNYHLGNKFTKGKQEGICYAPCNSKNIPAYNIDPLLIQEDDITDLQNETNISNNITDRCINKNDFMMGKYEFTPEYCPLSWVFRIHYKTPKGVDDLKLKLKKIYQEYQNNNLTSTNTKTTSLNSGSSSIYMLNEKNSTEKYNVKYNNNDYNKNLDICDTKIKTNTSKNNEDISNTDIVTSDSKITDTYNKLISDIEISNRAMEIIDKIDDSLDNIPIKFDQQTCDACNSLNTIDRLTDAYNICSLYKNQPELDDGSNRISVLKQACNALFSNNMKTNYNSTSFELLPNKEDITFQTKQLKDSELLLQNDDPKPVILDNDLSNVFKAIITAISIILLVIFIILFMILFNDIIYPYIVKPLFDIIRRVFFGIPQGVISYVDSVKIKNEDDFNSKAMKEIANNSNTNVQK